MINFLGTVEEEEGLIIFHDPGRATKIPMISRFEYITNEGRQIVEYGEFEFQLQDDNRTLKVFKL